MNSGSPVVPMRSLPTSSPLSARAVLRSVCAAPMTRSASGSSRRPASVNAIPLDERSNSVTPSSSSSALICALTAGWLRCNLSDARVECPVSATTTKVRS
jgi:hypothetical protein